MYIRFRNYTYVLDLNNTYKERKDATKCSSYGLGHGSQSNISNTSVLGGCDKVVRFPAPFEYQLGRNQTIYHLVNTLKTIITDITDTNQCGMLKYTVCRLCN